VEDLHGFPATFLLRIAEHVQGDAVADVLLSANPINHLLHLAVATVPPFHVEESMAFCTVVLRILQMDVTGTATNQIAHVRQNAGEGVVAITTLTTIWAAPVLEVATAPNDPCWR
jgi:hypothetical protein